MPRREMRTRTREKKTAVRKKMTISSPKVNSPPRAKRTACVQYRLLACTDAASDSDDGDHGEAEDNPTLVGEEPEVTGRRRKGKQAKKKGFGCEARGPLYGARPEV